MKDPSFGKNIKRILVQRADRLGDVVFCLPVIHWLKARYPDAEIHFLAAKQPAEFLRGQLTVDRVHVAPGKWSVLTLLGMASRLRAFQFDMVISLWNDPWLVWVVKLAGIPIRIGDATNLSLRWLHTHTVFQQWTRLNQHQIEFNLALLKPLGYRESDPVRFESDVDPTARRSVKAELIAVNDMDAPVVVVVCGSGGSNSPLPESVINLAIEDLSDSLQVVLVGFSDQALRAPDGVINRLNATSMAELVAWLSVADVVVAADTGPTHIAASLNRPIVFVPLRKSNLPTRWGPWTQDVMVLRSDHRCSARPPLLCTDNPCLGWPTPQAIVDAVHRLITHPETLTREVRAKRFLAASIHLMVVADSPVHAHALRRLKDRWALAGYTVIVVPRMPWWHLVDVILRFNTLVVVAPRLSKWTARLIRFWIGVVTQYLPPVVIRHELDITRSISSYEDELNEVLTRQEGIV